MSTGVYTLETTKFHIERLFESVTTQCDKLDEYDDVLACIKSIPDNEWNRLTFKGWNYSQFDFVISNLHILLAKATKFGNTVFTPTHNEGLAFSELQKTMLQYGDIGVLKNGALEHIQVEPFKQDRYTLKSSGWTKKRVTTMVEKTAQLVIHTLHKDEFLEMWKRVSEHPDNVHHEYIMEVLYICASTYHAYTKRLITHVGTIINTLLHLNFGIYM